MKKKDILARIIVALVALIPVSVHAEDTLIRKWRSDPIQIDTETLTMVFEFKDPTNMVMGFETDNKIHSIGQCISYISVNGIYDKIGPIFITHIDGQSLKAVR